MLIETLKELSAAKAKVAELEAAVAEELPGELRELPASFGFENAVEFIAAVRAASGKRRGRKPGSGRVAGGTTAAGKPRRRSKITDEMRAEVKKLVEARTTGNEIAKTLGISLPSVQNIKKALGLVRKK